MTSILVIDSDKQARRRMASALRFAGYAVETPRSARASRSLLHRRRVAAAVVDPAGDVETVVALRAVTDIPIVVVSTSGEEWDTVAMLDAGADDYLAKPYGVEEFLARLRALLRRVHVHEHEQVDPPVMTDDFTIDVADRRWSRRDGTEVRLTPTEWKLVEALVRRPGRLVTQAELLRSVWGPGAEHNAAYLRVYLAGLRHKVEPEPHEPRYFVTVPALGVRFLPDAGRAKLPGRAS